MLQPFHSMNSALSSALQRGKAFLTPSTSSDSLLQPENGRPGSKKAPEGALFPKVDPRVDGEDCDRDCGSCTIQYPAKWKIDENQHLYGHVHAWATHILVATGKTDWVRDVEDEKGSVMEAVEKYGKNPSNGKLMLSASNMPLPTDHENSSSSAPTTVLLLPAFTIVENVTPASVPSLITDLISSSSTTTTPLGSIPVEPPQPSVSSISPFTTRPCPHDYLILLCSQRTRDARCGQSAPLLRREFERHLRPLGLFRDLHDDRPGGVGIYFISHVGGHKFSANVMVYRRQRQRQEGGAASGMEQRNTYGEAGQCIWLARVRPEDCEGIIKFTVLQGKVVKPERQLRGGFNREKGLVSW